MKHWQRSWREGRASRGQERYESAWPAGMQAYAADREHVIVAKMEDALCEYLKELQPQGFMSFRRQDAPLFAKA